MERKELEIYAEIEKQLKEQQIHASKEDIKEAYQKVSEIFIDQSVEQNIESTVKLIKLAAG